MCEPRSLPNVANESLLTRPEHCVDRSVKGAAGLQRIVITRIDDRAQTVDAARVTHDTSKWRRIEVMRIIKATTEHFDR